MDGGYVANKLRQTPTSTRKSFVSTARPASRRTTPGCQTFIEGRFAREFAQSPAGPLPPNGQRVTWDLSNISSTTKLQVRRPGQPLGAPRLLARCSWLVFG